MGADAGTNRMRYLPPDSENIFRNLRSSGYCVASEVDGLYNCIAYAAGVTSIWWWPEATPQDGVFWPPNVPAEETIEAFVLAYGTIGYEPCENGDVEEGFEKVAIYAVGDVPTHAARQLTDGTWTSKLGKNVDITHTTPRGVEGPAYGLVGCYLRRPRPAPLTP